MTIAISIKVHDGVVLAADSAATVISTDQAGNATVLNVYNTANKVFNLYKGLPIGGLTWGAGAIGTASISTLTKDLRRRFMGGDPAFADWALDRTGYSLEAVASRTRQFLYEEHYEPTFAEVAQKPVLGFLVAGYSSGQDLAEEWTLQMDSTGCPAPMRVRALEETGLTWSGEPEAVSRLVLGHGAGLPQVLTEIGVTADQIQEVMRILHQRLQVPFAAAPMPIQDVIDLAEFLVHSTIMFSRFAPGAPTVGGPIEIAAITKHEGFKWVQRKYYYDLRLNPEG